MTMPFTPLDPRGTVLGDEVYALLGEAILDGKLAPGERLRDHELAERLGVSRTPVREALQRLERSGLVEVSPNRYTRVSIPNARCTPTRSSSSSISWASSIRMAVRAAPTMSSPSRSLELDDVIAASRADDHDGTRCRRATRSSTRIDPRDRQRRLPPRHARGARSRSAAPLPGWQPFIECPIGRTAAYESFRDAVADRDGARAESVLRDIHGFS